MAGKAMLSAIQAAEVIGVNRSRVLQLCREKRLKGAQKLGTFWAIPASSAREYADTRSKN